MSATDRSRARLHDFLSRTKAARDGRLDADSPPYGRRNTKKQLPLAQSGGPFSPVYEYRLQNFLLFMTVAFLAGVFAILCGKLFMFHIASDMGLTGPNLQTNGSVFAGCLIFVIFALVLRYRSLIEYGSAMTGFFALLLLEPSFVASFPNAWAGFFSDSYVQTIKTAHPDTTPWMWNIVRDFYLFE
ncbi:hypothetical protein SAMN04488515_3414 [Cognatiyoonia koreensis]|uniref:Uncharacterized protein n=1 Tax=Cognatiyoonia koreensis TaxID=364200 RepID=A0A1I0RWZ9_9RHOB|nr:hypothetical protein [Cognatiyoonia koreensis]SEW45945.1 hypothetical protein SAMN04488515_3414 [Cognatiyoonia koreensis]